jgi:hypothetical protein
VHDDHDHYDYDNSNHFDYHYYYHDVDHYNNYLMFGFRSGMYWER